MNCKGGHFSLVNIVLGGQYSPVNFVLGGQYSPVNNVPPDILWGDSIHCNNGTVIIPTVSGFATVSDCYLRWG